MKNMILLWSYYGYVGLEQQGLGLGLDKKVLVTALD